MQNAMFNVMPFLHSLCTRYFAFEFTLDIVFLGVYLKQANNTRQAMQANKLPPPHTQIKPVSAVFPMQGYKNSSKRF